MERIIEPIQSEIELFEERLGLALRSEVSLVDQMARYLVAIKGKRFRPALVMLTAQALGEVTDRAVNAAVAIELIHTATLVHDDVVDSSKLRRGVASVNAIWDNQISVLMGDFLFSRAFSIFVNLGSEKALEAISRATERVAKGELSQIEKSFELNVTEESYFEMIGDKTAALVSASCEIGAILANGSPYEVELMARFGENLGLAFQIADDLLDFVGDADVSGKPVGSDVKERKVTLPLIWALSNCGDAERGRICERIEEGLEGETDWQEIVGFVERYGGIGYARRRAKEYASAAEKQLVDLKRSAAREALERAVEYAIERER